MHRSCIDFIWYSQVIYRGTCHLLHLQSCCSTLSAVGRGSSRLGLSLSLHLRELRASEAKQARGHVDTVRGDDGPESPAPAADQHDEDGGGPRHPDDVKHVLGQAGGGQVLAGRLESAGRGVVAGAAGALEDKFAGEGRRGEHAVEHEGARAQQKVGGEEDEVDNGGAQVQVIECGDVGLGAVFFRFLRHCDGCMCGRLRVGRRSYGR